MIGALEAQVADLTARLEALEASRRSPATPDGLQLPLFVRSKQERIVQVVAAEWHVDTADVVGRIREGFAMQPRFAAIWLARQLIKLSLPQLGRLFNRDHTTIMHALKRAEGWRIADEDFRWVTDRLLGQLRSEFTAARS